jgi:hypothetical protein
MLGHSFFAPLFYTTHVSSPQSESQLTPYAVQFLEPSSTLVSFCIRSLPSTAPPVFPSLAIAFAPLSFTEGNSTLLAIRDEKPLLPRLAQHSLALHLLAKALEQLVL